MATLTTIEGVGGTYAQKLREAGIQTTEALLEKGASPQGRKEIADTCTAAQLSLAQDRLDVDRETQPVGEWADGQPGAPEGT